MLRFMMALIEASIAMSALALVYIAVTPVLSRIFSAKGRYYAWLVIIAGLIIPFRYHPQAPAIYMDPILPPLGETNLHSAESSSSVMSSVPWDALAGGLWLAGTVVFIAVHIIRHRRFLSTVKRWSRPISDQHVLSRLQAVQAELQIKQKVELRVCPGISSPMLLGFFRPTILLPTDNIPPDELPLILKHELVHFKRGDVWYKTLVLTATALHWFNPVVYMISRQIAIQCEISCDEEVVKNSDGNGRQQYVEAIIGIIRKPSGARSQFTTNFYSGKQGMKHRVFSIMDARSKKRGTSIMLWLAVATFSTGAILQISQPETSREPSASAALKKGSGLISTENQDSRKTAPVSSEKARPVSVKEKNQPGEASKTAPISDQPERDPAYEVPKLLEMK